MTTTLAGHSKAEHEEAAGMGLEDVFLSHHEQPCDCAVCDDIAFRKSVQKGFMSIAEVHEHEKLLREEFDDAQGKIARLQVDLHQTVVDCEQFKVALKKIARGTLEPGHVYEQAVMMQDIAIKALQEAHGCTVMGAKVCFACGECDPVTLAE